VGRLPSWSFVAGRFVKLFERRKAMNSKMCASSDTVKRWSEIDFNRARNYVQKLQIRIAKAYKEGRYNKVKSLQRLLVTSFYAKSLAVKRVTENKGGKTAGVDGELWTTPKLKFEAITQLKRNGYSPKPLKRIYIPKSNGKKRPLSIPTMKDRAMQTLYKFALEPIAEVTADNNSYGFRIGRCTQDAVEQCFITLAKTRSPKWILEGDIKGCFDNISHEWIIENIPMDKQILSKWLKCGYIETKKLFPTKRGAPQGSPISPTISNMVLDGMEKVLSTRFFNTTRNRKPYIPMVNFVRFADDFIISGKSKELLQEDVLPAIKEFLLERGLSLSEEKTVITHIDKGFDFLGFNVRKYKGKLLIKPSKKNIKAFLNKIRTIIKSNKSIKQEQLIQKLNPRIRGWVNYHKFNVSSKTFNHVDKQVFKCLWRWSLRRHKNKGKKWIKAKYFHSIGNRNWYFAYKTDKTINDGQPYYYKLEYAVNSKISRFVKIKAEANPFLEEYAEYFNDRENYKMRNSINGRKRLEYMYKTQKGLCPICKEKITTETDFVVIEINTSKFMTHPQCRNRIKPKKLTL